METEYRLLLIGDDALFRQALADGLRASGFAVTDGPADADWSAETVDVAILDSDAARPAPSQTCDALKAAAPNVPVIAIGANAVADADISLRKPVRLGQVMAALDDLLRQRQAWSVIGPWRFDSDARRLDDGNGRLVRLTDKETAILTYLGANSGAVPRERLLAAVWGYSGAVATHTLETHIYRLRRKIEPDPSQARLLVTEPGGYRLNRDESQA